MYTDVCIPIWIMWCGGAGGVGIVFFCDTFYTSVSLWQETQNVWLMKLFMYSTYITIQQRYTLWPTPPTITTTTNFNHNFPMSVKSYPLMLVNFYTPSVVTMTFIICICNLPVFYRVKFFTYTNTTHYINGFFFLWCIQLDIHHIYLRLKVVIFLWIFKTVCDLVDFFFLCC